ncbi:ferritin-like domain-containing protein [Micromonospora sp. WMMD882]|uniref:ferritin-like domain-containing protein n=1 Tax=Micromonospora sp. WMMD882 TaxID=3015151 RepID=UPI00248B067D|nr:ferritin-like domain-containing protein [Micromonospora sp. WMMD882]WBB80753.1 ferritin-like domain-containing protein [Micromonospora sp. WMMD882]
MTLLRPDDLDGDELAYRIFQVTRDREPWRIEDVLRQGRFSTDPVRAERAWRVASAGYYAEQAGLVAAATLAAETEDAPLRFSLALATADEARHADAFYRYAKAVGGEPADALDTMQPLDDGLTALPYMGRALVHTMLEGLAADEFVLLGEVFAGDPLGRLYHHVRRDEIRHVAIGLNYLARATRTAQGRDAWQAHAQQWHDIGYGLTGLEQVAAALAEHTGRDAAAVQAWFLRRHRARLTAAGITIRT